MKFWELISAYRSEPDILRAIFQNPQWNTFGNWYQNFPEIVSTQNRTILDSGVPEILALEVAAKSQQKFLYYPELHLLKEFNQHSVADKQSQILTALEVTDRFGGACIEEVLEYGSCHVKERS